MGSFPSHWSGVEIVMVSVPNPAHDVPRRLEYYILQDSRGGFWIPNVEEATTSSDVIVDGQINGEDPERIEAALLEGRLRVLDRPIRAKPGHILTQFLPGRPPEYLTPGARDMRMQQVWEFAMKQARHDEAWLWIALRACQATELSALVTLVALLGRLWDNTPPDQLDVLKGDYEAMSLQARTQRCSIKEQIAALRIFGDWPSADLVEKNAQVIAKYLNLPQE